MSFVESAKQDWHQMHLQLMQKFAPVLVAWAEVWLKLLPGWTAIHFLFRPSETIIWDTLYWHTILNWIKVSLKYHRGTQRQHIVSHSKTQGIYGLELVIWIFILVLHLKKFCNVKSTLKRHL